MIQSQARFVSRECRDAMDGRICISTPCDTIKPRICITPVVWFNALLEGVSGLGFGSLIGILPCSFVLRSVLFFAFSLYPPSLIAAIDIHCLMLCLFPRRSLYLFRLVLFNVCLSLSLPRCLSRSLPLSPSLPFSLTTYIYIYIYVYIYMYIISSVSCIRVSLFLFVLSLSPSLGLCLLLVALFC